MEKDPEQFPAWWVGRLVRRVDEDESCLGPATVLAVDDTAYAPSAWIKYAEAGDYPAYRSVDLSDIEDLDTGVGGPRWGSAGPEAAAAEIRARHQAALSPTS